MDLTILFALDSWESTKLKTTVGLCWRAILFSNPLSGAAGKIAPETSVPRESLPLVQPNCPTYLHRKIVSTQSRFYFTEPSVTLLPDWDFSFIVRQCNVACMGYRGSLDESLSSLLIDELDFIRSIDNRRIINATTRRRNFTGRLTFLLRLAIQDTSRPILNLTGGLIKPIIDRAARVHSTDW